jgi:ABC-2 type transport system permease protein
VPPGPIADVSYRPYDGPQHRRRVRWWIVARATLGMAVRRWAFWVLAVFGALPYLGAGFQHYMRSQIPMGPQAFMPERAPASYFYDSMLGFGGAEFSLFLLALMVGAGSIAGDNRTNALQIYLARPITKGDYLVGKWAGVFLTLAAVSLLPALALFLYLWGSLAGTGFFRQQPWLAPQVLLVSCLPPLLHASLMLGFSAWNRQPVRAGGFYAAFYIGSLFAAPLAGGILRRTGHEQVAPTIRHCSLPGLIQGLGQNIYDVAPTFFGLPIRGRGGFGVRPDWPLLVVLVAVLVVAGLIAARARIRAVEVVQG